MARKSSLAGKIVLSCLVPAVLAAVPGFLGLYGALAEKIGFGAVISAVLLVTAGLSVLSCLLTVYRPVKKLAEFLREAGEKEGDLTRRMPISTHDELSLIARNHNVFIAQIHRIVFKLKNIVSRSNSMGRELASSAVEMSASIEEISSTTKSLASREQTLNDYIHSSRGDIQEIRQSIEKIINQIDTQAASVNQSSAAVEQTVSSIRSMNRLSEVKSELAGHLNALAGEGEKDMRQTLDSIQEIASSVDIVQDLIKVINSVASKTNLLAMNAAIEAAHAGNHGKGFSVVADEIRKLAETTSRNAKEISESLSQMVKGIETSRQLTEKTDGSIKQMISGIKDVADSLQEIRSGLNEMAAGTGQITSALSDLVTITENIKSDSRNIGTKAEQIDAAMGQVTDISEETTHSMEEFYIGINEIQKATHFISQVGSENAENIAIVDQEVSRFTIIDTSHLKSSDGQPLIQWNHIRKAIPDRPSAPEKLPESDPGHWYDLEFVGWNVKKTNIPSSPADGTNGKKVILLESCDHPYHTAYKKGCSQVADAFGIRFSSYNADYSPDKQEQQVAMAIRDKPDLIILTPTSVDRSTQWFKQINKAGIPVVGSNTTPSPEGFKYILAWTGPDDWGQFRLLASEFAKEMGKEGGYAIIRHAKGNSNYFSRTFSVLTELKKIAPNMECLAMESAIEEEETYRLTSRWLKEYGSRLKGIAFSDPAFGSKGLCRAVKDAGRDDIVVVSSGNSLVTQDLVKAGEVKAITYQSAEADGALAMEIAVDWFNGMEIPPIRYLPMGLITSENVGDYYPSQW